MVCQGLGFAKGAKMHDLEQAATSAAMSSFLLVHQMRCAPLYILLYVPIHHIVYPTPFYHALAKPLQALPLASHVWLSEQSLRQDWVTGTLGRAVPKALRFGFRAYRAQGICPQEVERRTSKNKNPTMFLDSNQLQEMRGNDGIKASASAQHCPKSKDCWGGSIFWQGTNDGGKVLLFRKQ